MDLIKTFEESVMASRSLPNQSNENLLKLYSLYKQATEGDVNIEKPENFFDIAAIAKYNAWESLQGITTQSAMQQYIDLVASLKS